MLHIFIGGADTHLLSIPFNNDLVLAIEKAKKGLAQIDLSGHFEHLNMSYAAML